MFLLAISALKETVYFAYLIPLQEQTNTNVIKNISFLKSSFLTINNTKFNFITANNKLTKKNEFIEVSPFSGLI